jgi:toxin-antitoxin system PIN domain toxin
LDVNVLLALAWPNHPFHKAATARMGVGQLWATCALTELGFVRLSSNPVAVPGAVMATEAAMLLSAMTKDLGHVFLAELPSVAKWFSIFVPVRGHNQVTDAYLLALARHHKNRLITFDSRLRGLGDVEVLAANSG